VCGRFTLKASPRAVATTFGLSQLPEQPPRYNVAPSQLIAVVGNKPDGTGRGLVPMRWGLVPR
jgi:putative SOS response-associated peptidase YedK